MTSSDNAMNQLAKILSTFVCDKCFYIERCVPCSNKLAQAVNTLSSEWRADRKPYQCG